MILTSHYMDEVEALAAPGGGAWPAAQIVAAGTPDSIGGRDAGLVTIRFRLPDGVSAADLPVPAAAAANGGEIEIRTEDELPVLHALTGWALGPAGRRCPGSPSGGSPSRTST